MPKINIAELDKAQWLVELFELAILRGFGLLQVRKIANLHGLSISVAQEIIGSAMTRFEYFTGWPLKIDINGDEMDSKEYDSYNGKGKAQEATTRALSLSVMDQKEKICFNPNASRFTDALTNHAIVQE